MIYFYNVRQLIVVFMIVASYSSVLFNDVVFVLVNCFFHRASVSRKQFFLLYILKGLELPYSNKSVYLTSIFCLV